MIEILIGFGIGVPVGMIIGYLFSDNRNLKKQIKK